MISYGLLWKTFISLKKIYVVFHFIYSLSLLVLICRTVTKPNDQLMFLQSHGMECLIMLKRNMSTQNPNSLALKFNIWISHLGGCPPSFSKYYSIYTHKANIEIIKSII